jgi:hypothetical protein
MSSSPKSPIKMSDTVQVQTDTVSKVIELFEKKVYSPTNPQTTMSSSPKSPIKMPCNPPCEKKMMIGRSWWKQMGYNSPCQCCFADLKMKEEKKEKCDNGDCNGGRKFKNESGKGEFCSYECADEEAEECCFDDCEETFKYGNNALPLREAKCCDECNSTKVIPARMFRDFKASYVGGILNSLQIYNGTT